MNNVHELKKTIGNLTIKARIDLRPKAIVKTMAIILIITIALWGLKNGFK